MIKPPYYHIGIVVRNHQEAIRHYTNLLDVEFTEPTDTALCIENPQTQQTENLKVVAAYSRTRSPYLELIQAGGKQHIFGKKCRADPLLRHLGIRPGRQDKKIEGARDRHRCAHTSGM
jgi:hypothetical protein